jgi:Protein of unknown function (DUF3307)
VTWAPVFIVFYVSHLVGDYLVQTDWQARHKRGGLGHNRTARKALLSHIATYAMAFVPALIWISSRLHWGTLLILVAVVVPHMVQDDGRLLTVYVRKVKGLDAGSDRAIVVYVDQAFHMLALLGAALLVSALR